ncbi:MAG: hypothetical protein ACQEQV_01450 [Fibrobacterota bacterium]
MAHFAPKFVRSGHRDMNGYQPRAAGEKGLQEKITEPLLLLCKTGYLTEYSCGRYPDIGILPTDDPERFRKDSFYLGMHRMKKEITRIDPLSAGRIFAVFHGLCALILAGLYTVQLVLLFTMGYGGISLTLWWIFFAAPLVGFCAGFFGALCYNYFARIVGGVLITLDEPKQGVERSGQREA